MRGQKVVVRADGGIALVRRVWETDQNAVYVTDDAIFACLERGEEAPFPIGFPKTDVFRYEPGVERRIGSPDWKWSSLSRFL